MRSAFVIFPLLWSLSAAFAQPGGLRNDMSELFSFGDDYFLEVAVVPSLDSAHSQCNVLFRFTYDLLEFRRERREWGRGGGFLATTSVFVEATNAEGIIVGRGVWSDTVRVDSFNMTNARNRFVCGSIALALKPGLHSVRYSFDNGRPGSGFTRTTEPFTVGDLRSPLPVVGTPLFLRSDDLDTLRTLSIDGNARFGHVIRCYVALGRAPSAYLVRYELLHIRTRAQPPLAVHSGSARAVIDGRPAMVLTPGDNIDIVFASKDSVDRTFHGAYIQIPSSDLSPGEYALVVTAENSAGRTTDTARFSLRWIDAPFSLSRPDYAIRALYPIATEDEIDRMLSGDRMRQQEALNLFWSERDPTPTTTYNEAMAEYYRRVDYASVKFRTIDRRDGVGSDRGKIYILNGPPTRVERDMDPTGPPREVWTYRNRVARVFIFSDIDRNGDYRLVAYRDL